jgi:[CysO sulfur-carrier protein]-S-L-cysteine hydrolase
VRNDIVRVHRAVHEELLAEARREPDLECCGFLAGRYAVISTILPAQNALRSATSYEIAPEELFALFRRIRAGGFEHLGIYHSHPHGENAPSPRDIDRAFYPAVAYFILSPRPDAPHPVRAFEIAGGQTRELHLEPV